MSPSSSAADKNWFYSAFSHDYVRIYRHRDQAEADRALASLLALAAPEPKARCLDLGCGFGRHLSQLRRRKLRAVGLDLSDVLLKMAAQNENIRGALVRGDMRNLPFRSGVFDWVFSFFTSFGYFSDDAVNAGVIQEMARVLQPDGGILIDFLNAARVRKTLVPEDHREFSDFSLTQRRWINPTQNTVEKELIVEDAGGQRRYRESVKLYGPDDFQAFFHAAGLIIQRLLGNADGAPWNATAERLILIGKRTA